MLDGLAFVKAQKDQGAELRGARALLVGAGGAGSAIAVALIESGVTQLLVHDTDGARVTWLIDRLSGISVGRTIASPPDPRGCDLVCNATPMGMTDGDPLPVATSLIEPFAFVGDVVAGRGETAFLRDARGKGCKTANGDQMVAAVQEMMVDFMLSARALPP